VGRTQGPKQERRGLYTWDHALIEQKQSYGAHCMVQPLGCVLLMRRYSSTCHEDPVADRLGNRESAERPNEHSRKLGISDGPNEMR